MQHTEAARSAVDAKRRRVQSLQDRCSGTSKRLDVARQEMTERLIAMTEVEPDEFVVGLTHRLVDHEQDRSVRREREQRTRLEFDVENEARKLITLGVQRYNESTVDRLRSSIRIEDAERREALLALSETFEAELGMTLETTDREDMISIRGADPLMKETSQGLTKMLRGPVDAKVFLGLARRSVRRCAGRSMTAHSGRSMRLSRR